MKMLELIDKQETLKKMCEWCGQCERFENAMRSTHPDFVTDKCNNYKFLAERPKIEAELVRHGRWIEIAYHPVGDTMYCDCNCSNCNFEITREKGQYPKFCENCGTQMSGGAEE